MKPENQEQEVTDDFKALEPMNDTPVATSHGVAAIALNLAMKYHDMNLIKDGTLYQQYKLEGRNIGTLHLDEVFETAMKIEAHLLGASERIAKMVVDAIATDIDKLDADDEGPVAPQKPE